VDIAKLLSRGLQLCSDSHGQGWEEAHDPERRNVAESGSSLPFTCRGVVAPHAKSSHVALPVSLFGMDPVAH
jgi:hypothetical protein